MKIKGEYSVLMEVDVDPVDAIDKLLESLTGGWQVEISGDTVTRVIRNDCQNESHGEVENHDYAGVIKELRQIRKLLSSNNEFKGIRFEGEPKAIPRKVLW